MLYFKRFGIIMELQLGVIICMRTEGFALYEDTPGLEPEGTSCTSSLHWSILTSKLEKHFGNNGAERDHH